MDIGYQELVFEDAMEVVIDQLNALGTQDPLTVQSLEGNMRDGMISNMVVMFLRMLTSCEIQRREDFFAPFIMVGDAEPVKSCPSGPCRPLLLHLLITENTAAADMIVFCPASTLVFTLHAPLLLHC